MTNSTNIVLPYVFDLELSGRCNTDCSFCPRDEMKRGEDYMSSENFEWFLTRLKSYSKFVNNREVTLPKERATLRVGEGEQSALRVIMCGMGESLMNPQCPEWIGRIRREVGIRVTVVTNGLLLKESIIQRLAANDTTVILVSVPGIDKESYAQCMDLDFDRVIRNIQRANEVLPGRININVTIPNGASFGPDDVTKFWAEKGIPLGGISLCHNRGGHLKDPSLTQIGVKPKSKFCGIIARHNFVAWDGRILSCCHDLHGSNVLGHVETHDFVELAKAKTPIVQAGPPYKICAGCNDGERYQEAQILVTAVPHKQTEELGTEKP